MTATIFIAEILFKVALNTITLTVTLIMVDRGFELWSDKIKDYKNRLVLVYVDSPLNGQQ